MKKRFVMGALLLACLTAMAQQPEELSPMRGVKNAFTYTVRQERTPEARAGFAPNMLVYPDAKLSQEQVAVLLQEMGLKEYADKYGATMGVVNPVGEKYDNVADFEAYKAMIDSMRVISNLKIIGIGHGATFVNQTIANHAEEVAGIVSINGKAGKPASSAAPVPVFIVGNGSQAVAKAYIQQNHATETSKEAHLVRYQNSEEPLLSVVVSQAKNQSLKEIMTDAWKSLLSKNYRFNNYKHTFYTGATQGQYGAYELEPYVMFNDLKITRNVIQKPLLDTMAGQSNCLWYEYLPESTLHAPKASVPLVILLHGHGNDPRTQSETSGFIELAAEENFIVAELEWQGNGYTAMGLDGIEQVVYELMTKYPQIDPERIYSEGLSAGAMNSSALGIRKSHVFAAVGAMSGGLFPEGFYYFGGRALRNEATQKRGLVETAYIGVFGTDDETIMYPKSGNWQGNSLINAWQIYETMNGMEVVNDYNFVTGGIFGQAVNDHETLTLKNIQVQTGQLYKGSTPLMKLVAVEHYGHWNFKPAARIMWDFFKHYSRDSITKKLVYHAE